MHRVMLLAIKPLTVLSRCPIPYSSFRMDPTAVSPGPTRMAGNIGRIGTRQMRGVMSR
ncbi:hypothetical protein PF010_g30039 [Phytophthora fragariae]|uniref:RxLR effector protein n=1 Tax=Phytophthora fragariae TaxID=53985 RepID=A0A6A3DCV8_9STRA|nr:hypothetical protein PF009_g31568 [Phytophthora fragariae]KAE8960899.1 hypothetical protein PF011_g29940 [Phytophthora fragariae]KAE9054034.1 hypothetical protein PF007_g32757 [Phytophthora fragariae]KAE9059982.1 hypothetical protein PF006_g31754 [Phytophthora fragariae]KAE9060876.1 hypothetical protein PF010_g30039 [Phytophthora fragariae]